MRLEADDAALACSHRLRSKLLSALLLAGFLGTPVQAQESFRYGEAAAHGPLLALTPSLLQSAPLTLRRAPTAKNASLAEPLSPLLQKRAASSLIRTSLRSRDISSDSSVMLLSKKMKSRHAYKSRAGLYSGYGQFFPGDTIARTGTCGAGIDDPDWFYVKVSVQF